MKSLEQMVIDGLGTGADRLRVALVTETYPPEVNGVAMTWGNLVKGMRALGHSVQIVRPRQACDADAGFRAAEDLVLATGIPIPKYPELRFGIMSQKQLLQLWRKNRPDVVHIATEGPLGWCAIGAAQKLSLPVTSSFHTNFHQYSGHYGFGLLKVSIDAYMRKFHNRTLATLVPTRAMVQALQERGFQHVSVLSRGIALQQFSPRRRSPQLRAAWGVRENDVVVLYVGRLAREKNVGVVLDAFAAIRARQPSARLVIVGDGPLRTALAEACSHAVFTGVKTGSDLAACYASSDLFLFPSLTETFGNVVPEALASGLAVVSYACAAAANLITHNRNGVLVTPGEEAAFIAASVAIAGEHDRRTALRQHAAPSVAHMTWSAVTHSLIDTLRAVIDRHEHYSAITDTALTASPLTPGHPTA